MFALLVQEEKLPSSAKYWIYTFPKYLNPFCPQNYTDCVSRLSPTLKKSTTKLIKFKGANTSQPACKPPRETLGFIMQAFIEWKSRNIFRKY